jgi:hypothetical protein
MLFKRWNIFLSSWLQTKFHWSLCFGSEARQDIVVVGICDREGWSLHGARKQREEQRGPGTTYSPTDIPPMTDLFKLGSIFNNFHHFKIMPSNYESINWLIHWLGQSSYNTIILNDCIHQWEPNLQCMTFCRNMLNSNDNLRSTQWPDLCNSKWLPKPSN